MKNKPIWIGMLIGFVYSILALYIAYFFPSKSDVPGSGLSFFYIPLVLFVYVGGAIMRWFGINMHSDYEFLLVSIFIVFIVTLIGGLIGHGLKTTIK